MALNFVLLTFGAFWFYPRLIGTFINCCCGCCNLGGFIFALGVRFNPLGAHCVLNVAPLQYEGDSQFNDSWTYKKDGGVLAAFGTLQIIFWFCQCYCCHLPLYYTPNKPEFNIETMAINKKRGFRSF